ncbi:helix-turn-helix domain-containing protein [Sphingomonas sp. CL5.1]|nr:helix-turn-helix domain-containing protein [Sphingomonas sp. CL5.1]
MNRLFEFLIERSLAGRIPKEIEVAQEVFGLSVSEQIGHDATVRMSIHRLRKKLEDLPANTLGERLVLPRGEYRLQLLAPADAATPSPEASASRREGPPGASDGSGARRGGWRSRSTWLAAGVVLMLLLSAVAAWRGFSPQRAAGDDPRLRSAFWQPLARAHFPVLLVSGDRYTFGEVDSQGKVFRELRDPAITSSEVLDRYKSRDAKQGERYVDLNLFDLPSAMAPAIAVIAPIVSEATRGQGANTPITSSRFTTDMLKAHNIVYVGLLSDLRDLCEPIFDSSGFELAPDGDALVDRRSHRRFQSDWADPSQERMLRRDYVYVASLPGPYGNRILVIAGMNDPALAESAQIVARRADLDTLTARVGKAQAFEALYEVRTFGPSSVASQLIVARATQVGHQWRAPPNG